MEDGGAESEGKAASVSSPSLSTTTTSPWSLFHSSLTLVARGPGTPVRHHPEAHTSPKSSPSRSAGPPSTVAEFQEHFTELDLLLE